MPNFTKPLGNVVLGTAWLWLLPFVGLHGPAVLWLAPLPAHPAALQLDGSILQTCTGVLPKLRERFEVRPGDPAGLQKILPGWGLAVPYCLELVGAAFLLQVALALVSFPVSVLGLWAEPSAGRICQEAWCGFLRKML